MAGKFEATAGKKKKWLWGMGILIALIAAVLLFLYFCIRVFRNNL